MTQTHTTKWPAGHAYASLTPGTTLNEFSSLYSMFDQLHRITTCLQI